MTLWRPGDLAAAWRQRRTMSAREHRPWPLPDRPWVMGQTWEDLLFMHWPVDPERLRKVVPEQIPIDTFEGSAWVAVTPFAVTGMRPRFSVPLPYTARFPEVNVRTYATIGGKPGIWFFSLDTTNRLAVAAARRAYRLPYFPASIDMERAGGRVELRHERTQADAPPAALSVAYGPSGQEAPRPPAPDSFEEWACERYCLYTLDDRGRVLRGQIHHPPWQLEEAGAEVAPNAMAEQLEIALPGTPRLHLARRQDVLFWLNEAV
jgi:uncharacterized protein YqjF (DUF2071 family)